MQFQMYTDFFFWETNQGISWHSPEHYFLESQPDSAFPAHCRICVSHQTSLSEPCEPDPRTRAYDYFRNWSQDLSAAEQLVVRNWHFPSTPLSDKSISFHAKCFSVGINRVSNEMQNTAVTLIRKIAGITVPYGSVKLNTHVWNFCTKKKELFHQRTRFTSSWQAIGVPNTQWKW